MKKKITALVMAAAMCLSFAACGSDNGGDTAKDTYTVGICQLVQHPALDAATQGFKDALKEELGDKVELVEQNAANDIPTCGTICNGFVSDGVDLILANATPALQAAVSATQSIPILGTAVTEYGVALGIKNFSGTVGGNISGTSDSLRSISRPQCSPSFCPMQRPSASSTARPRQTPYTRWI